uniref:Uncharacterized protein n=1 Tax=Florenciella parvula TaxID=236787 RepID=A0A7S2G387_9STRA|mmetsp:Transcript_3433/g.7204  ORF Transcript_3433/g.7204 Transcript_3433/m.7204 type:complete len:200 (+) Transcript_3433:124-723(+)
MSAAGGDTTVPHECYQGEQPLPYIGLQPTLLLAIMTLAGVGICAGAIFALLYYINTLVKRLKQLTALIESISENSVSRPMFEAKMEELRDALMYDETSSQVSRSRSPSAENMTSEEHMAKLSEINGLNNERAERPHSGDRGGHGRQDARRTIRRTLSNSSIQSLRDSLSNSSLRDSLTANDLVSLEYMFGDQDSAGVSC